MQLTMPALSVRQPWAWLIVQGIKDVENRDWKTPFRGRVLIHASKSGTRAEFDRILSDLARAGLMPAGMPEFDQLPRGGIVGEARIVDCVQSYTSEWFVPGGFGFVLRDAKPSPFWPFNGRLGFFDVPVADPRNG